MPLATLTHYAAQRFLTWPVPADFYPDSYISFDRETAMQNKCIPIGTNLLTLDQAKAMFVHCLKGLVPEENEADRLLCTLGLSPEEFRTSRGRLNYQKVKTALQGLSNPSPCENLPV